MGDNGAMRDAYLDIDTPGLSALLLMLCPQPTEHLVALRPTERVLCKRSRDDLERGRIPLHGMLREALEPAPIRLHAPSELELRSARAGHEPRILEQRLDHVDAVVDRALQVVQMVRRRAPQHDRRRARLFGARVVPRLVRAELSEDGDAVAADFFGLEDVDVAGFFGGGRADAGEGGGVDDAAESAEVEFGEDFEDGDVESVEVVEGEFADGGSGDDDLDARIGDLFEDLACHEGECSYETARAQGGPFQCVSPLRG